MKSILLILAATLGITAASTAQNVPTYIPTNGLVGWWPFNGNANDESGNGNDGTVNGATLTADRFGNTNKAYSFDGINDIINASANNLPTGSSSRALSFWYLLNSINQTNDQKFMIRYGGGSPCSDWCSTIWPSSNFPTLDINLNYVVYSNSIQLGNWYHYVVTYEPLNGTNILAPKVYINGILQTNQNLINNTCSINTLNLLPLNIGGSGSGNTNQFFDGKIDDIAIWNRALTPQEITALYTASSTNNNETSNTSANVPGAIHYQAVARDAQGAPLVDANLQVRFTLIADSLSGTAEYAETHSLTTNSMGLFTTAFGAGTPVSNTFGNINWSSGNKFLKVQIDTGNGLVDIGTQQLLSTPYSMHSATSGAIKNPGLPVFEDNAAALAGGLVAGDMYRTASGDLKIVY